jgi:competence protein CoiA
VQYALIEGERREAFVGGKGSCPICRGSMVSKCGPRVLHHWAHARRKNCDPWWENETEWHRAWKNHFPAEYREVSYVAPDGEVHRADIVTQTNIVIEFQHSSMTDAERASRENFYKNLVWVIDGKGFRANFDICHPLPAPKSGMAQDLVWFKATRSMRGATRGLFLRKSERANSETDGLMHGIGEIEEAVNRAYRGHHQYDWVRPRRTWLDATCAVYIDFGEEELVRLDIYGDTGMRCIYRVAKRKFLHDVQTETQATAIATRFYVLPALR